MTRNDEARVKISLIFFDHRFSINISNDIAASIDRYLFVMCIASTTSCILILLDGHRFPSFRKNPLLSTTSKERSGFPPLSDTSS